MGLLYKVCNHLIISFFLICLEFYFNKFYLSKVATIVKMFPLDRTLDTQEWDQVWIAVERCFINVLAQENTHKLIYDPLLKFLKYSQQTMRSVSKDAGTLAC